MNIEKIVVKKTVAAKDYRYAIYFNVLLRNRFMLIGMGILSAIAVAEIVYCIATGIANHLNYMLLSAVLIIGFTAYILYKT